jgi:hypothetical protein
MKLNGFPRCKTILNRIDHSVCLAIVGRRGKGWRESALILLAVEFMILSNNSGGRRAGSIVSLSSEWLPNPA